MWSRVSSYLTLGKSSSGGEDKGTHARRGGGNTSATTIAGSPHVLLVHVVLHDVESDGPATALANVLSREFACGVDAGNAWDVHDPHEAIRRSSLLFERPHSDGGDGTAGGGHKRTEEDRESASSSRVLNDIDIGGDSGADDDLTGSSPRALLRHIVGDGSGMQRYALVRATSGQHRCSHVVLLAPRNKTSSILPAVNSFTMPAAGGDGASSLTVVARTGAVVVVGLPGSRTSVAVEHDDDDNDVDDGGGLYSDQEDANGHGAVAGYSPRRRRAGGGTFHVAADELDRPDVFAATVERLRWNLWAQATTVRADGASAVTLEPSSVSVGSAAAGAGGDSNGQELAPSQLSLSCQSASELERLRPSQLSLLRTIAANVDRSAAAGAGAGGGGGAINYHSINTASERFYNSLGQFPACVRVMRNLGFTTVGASNRALEFADDPRLATYRAADRKRTLALIDSRLAIANEAAAADAAPPSARKR